MKTELIPRLVALSVALLAVASLPGQAQEFSKADVEGNRAVATSPRALEAFPELARQRTSPEAEPTFQIAPLK